MLHLYSLDANTDAYRNTLSDTRGLHEGGAWKRDSDGSTLHGSLDDLLRDHDNDNNSAFVPGKGAMWLGTEDGKWVNYIAAFRYFLESSDFDLLLVHCHFLSLLLLNLGASFCCTNILFVYFFNIIKLKAIWKDAGKLTNDRRNK